MKRLLLMVVIGVCFAGFGWCQAPEQPAQGTVDVDRMIYSAPAGADKSVLRAGCLAQGGRIVEVSERCNDDEVDCGRVLDVQCFCKCCKRPSPEDMGGVLDKLHQYYPARSAPDRP